MPNQRLTKFVRAPRSVLDFEWMKMVYQAINALLNGKMVNGTVYYTDSNTVWEAKGGGMHWAASSRIYSKDRSYSGDKSVGDWVWVSPTDTVVITGVTDPDTNLTVKSYPGAYLALQNVSPVPDPDHPDDPTKTKYHIPQPNLPVPNNLDDPKNYWLLISPQANCLT
jgi:hypothetical protein